MSAVAGEIGGQLATGNGVLEQVFGPAADEALHLLDGQAVQAVARPNMIDTGSDGSVAVYESAVHVKEDRMKWHGRIVPKKCALWASPSRRNPNENMQLRRAEGTG